MKSGYSNSSMSDPLKIKKQSPHDKPIDGKNSPWDFTCPQYDQRSSSFVKAGTEYGLGCKNPVGHKNEPKDRVSTMPFGRVKTMRVDE